MLGLVTIVRLALPSLDDSMARCLRAVSPFLSFSGSILKLFADFTRLDPII